MFFLGEINNGNACKAHKEMGKDDSSHYQAIKWLVKEML